jgi:hypothetical protein
VAGPAAQFESQAGQSALPSVNLYREFTAILSSHNALDVLHDARHHAAVIVELLSAVSDLDASLSAYELVVRALVDVLKAAPSAYVVDKDMIEIGVTRPNFLEQLA